MNHERQNQSSPRPTSKRFRTTKILTSLAVLLPATFAAQTAFANGACPGNYTAYGPSSSMCCDGTVGQVMSVQFCNGEACTLNAESPNGWPVCYQEVSQTCRDMGSLHYYGGIVGGFCCDASLTADKNGCTGNICALDPTHTQGFPMCTPMEEVCVTGQHRYGEWVGGFCCDGTLGAGAGSCNGTVCALDPDRAQGLPVCPQARPCPAGTDRYGEWAGGFCCDGTVGAGGGYCIGTVCALDPARTQGLPLCAPATGTEGGQQFWSTSPINGPAFKFYKSAGAVVQSLANGVSISGDVTISAGPNQPAITLGGASITLTFGPEGYVSTLIGTANVALPDTGDSGIELEDLGTITVGLDWGRNLGSLEAPVQDDRQYLVLNVGAGLSGSFGDVSFEVEGGVSTKIVVDPLDPSVYFRGDLSGITGLSALSDIGVGVSTQGLLAWEPTTTWGVPGFEGVDSHVIFQGGGQLGNLPLTADGEIGIRFPTSTGEPMQIGINGTLSATVNVSPVLSFSLPLGSASLAASLGTSQSAYFSGQLGSGTQVLPLSLPIQMDGQVKAAGWISSNIFEEPGSLSLQGHATIGSYGLQNALLHVDGQGVEFSAVAAFPGFNLGVAGSAGYDGSYSMSGTIGVHIPIVAGWTSNELTYYWDDAVHCGSEYSANAVKCGTHYVETAWQCVEAWLAQCNGNVNCHPAECYFANTCTWPHSCAVHVSEPTHYYGDFNGTVTIGYSSNGGLTAGISGQYCLAGGGDCTSSVFSATVKELGTPSAKACVQATGLLPELCVDI